MHRAPRSAEPPTPPAGRAERTPGLALTAVLVLLLAACHTNTPPEPEMEYVHLPADVQNRVRFLPPYATDMPTGDFVHDQVLEIRIFGLDPATLQAFGETLGSELSTENGAIEFRDETYATTPVALTKVRQISTSQHHLRAEIRLPNGPDAPVCNEESARCLGYMDIFLFDGKKVKRNQAPPGFVPAPEITSVLPIHFKLLFPDSVGQVLGIGTDSLDTETGNCPSPFQTLPGQGLQAVGAGLQAVGAGLQAVGAVGGVFYGSAEDPDKFMTASTIGAEVRDYLPPDSYPIWDGVVFVIDDFSNGYGVEDLFSVDLSMVVPTVSHGALVMQHLRGLAGLPADYQPVPDGYGPENGPYYVLQVGDKNLYLQTVNVGEGDTEHTASKLRAAVEYYSSVKMVKHMVINMSFAVVPCSVLADYTLAAELTTFDDYLQALAAENSVGREYRGRFDRLVSSPVDVLDDELLTYLNNPATVGVDMFQVASAGNYGNCYALYPAALTQVISVGALEVSGGDNIELCSNPPVPLALSGGNYLVSGYSNLAEVAAPGGLFKLGMTGEHYLAYAGTSFSAPAVSLFLALDNMLKTPGCSPPANGAHPGLADGIHNMLPFYALEVPSALSIYCTGHQ